MKKFGKAVAIITKIVEIILWMGVVALLLIICAIGMFQIHLNGAVLGLNQQNGTLTSFGYSLSIIESNGMVNMKVLVFILLIAMISCILTALIYHNIYLVVQTTRRPEYPVEEITPFTDINVTRIRKIGIYCLLLPAMEFIIGILARFLVGIEGIELTVNFTGLIMGLVVLCLSYVFAYGVQLQKDVNGFI